MNEEVIKQLVGIINLMISPDNLGCEDILSDVPEINKNLKELGFDVQINVPEYME